MIDLVQYRWDGAWHLAVVNDLGMLRFHYFRSFLLSFLASHFLPLIFSPVGSIHSFEQTFKVITISMPISPFAVVGTYKKGGDELSIMTGSLELQTRLHACCIFQYAEHIKITQGYPSTNVSSIAISTIL